MEADNNKQEDNLDNYTNKKVNEGIQNLLEEKDLKIRWRAALESNPAVNDYFKGFRNENAKKDFLDAYLNTKYLSYTYGEMYKDLLERRRNQWIDVAHEQLQYIQQKKLFDLQCLWRAGQIDIEEVKLTLDFKIWENDVLNCPFLEPITQDDIAMYQDFLLQYKSEPDTWLQLDSWQEYEEFKNDYLSDNADGVFEIPEWYEYHNLRTGNGTLLLLPDIKGEKEAFYRNLCKTSKKAEQPTALPVESLQIDTRPFLSAYDEEQMQYFVTAFEDKETQKKYQYYKQGAATMDNLESHNVLDCILDADEPISVEANSNILEALEIAYAKYRFKKIADSLPVAYEQYMFNKRMGLRFEARSQSVYLEFRSQLIQQILEGRELNGEERNFEY